MADQKVKMVPMPQRKITAGKCRMGKAEPDGQAPALKRNDIQGQCVYLIRNKAGGQAKQAGNAADGSPCCTGVGQPSAAITGCITGFHADKQARILTRTLIISERTYVSLLIGLIGNKFTIRHRSSPLF